MDRFRVFSSLAAAAALLAASHASLVAEEARGAPADPTAKSLPMSPDAGPFSAYLDPRLRGEGPDAIERSDFEQAKRIAVENPALQPRKPGRHEKPAAKPASPPAHGGHAGHESSADGPGK
ncbi:MAG TPA: hypothetical protein VEL09_14610 [Burkholderiales bacterium]|nr:hypothetical protein [Burkholderiales bacterium]